ncbi:hypothetical protein FOZ60_012527 [Perkinsus olseni]|uniref:Uncharacterized protein n=1 Tax=Perkinsus olseni TaxID=32597 RepID=A0A7J6P9I0_PEROL|nr:hypothetical protein FOZ60_012527 [Perkinsus olseni]
MSPSPAEHTTVMNNLTLPSPSSEGSSYVYPTDTGENELGELNCKPARLVLEDGTEFEGYSFGYHGSVAGELVFNTGMVGYPESLTDPSYTGQLLCITFPLVGNYGVPSDELDHLGLPRHFEGKRVHVKALVISDYSFASSHYTAKRTLSEWLRREKVPGIFGVDTRAVTKHVRSCGAMLAKLVVADDGPAGEVDAWQDVEWDDPNVRVLQKEVSCTEVRVFHPAAPGEDVVDIGSPVKSIRRIGGGPDPDRPIHILAVDCGMKYNIIRYFVDVLRVQLTVVPWDYDFTEMDFDGLFLSNGPGDPTMCEATIKHILALAAGAKTYKMVFGNRGMNQPVIDLRTAKCYITPQNHGFAVDTESLPENWTSLFVNANDGTNEALDRLGEFDYSGSQCIKALKESNIMSVLINPNIATVQTSKGLADKVYFLPVTPEFVTSVIEIEKPDGLFCTFGGQTALNCAVALHDAGVLKKHNVRVLGTPISSIVMTEDRDLFSKAVETVGYKVAESESCTTVQEAVEAASKLGYPVLVRAAYALGGLGSGFAANEAELRDLLPISFAASKQVIVDKSLRGWKEVEYEVVRDSQDNCITVCNMENFDPMGIHTGDSIVVAPSQTLSNADYYRLRKCAIQMIRHIGIVGECNIQSTLDLSRSSALASKATGYPLAYVAAKLALGTDLVTLRNMVTKSTTACFEPSLDYCVVKVPRWDLKKFATVDPRVGSCMKSVGEVMAIGRKFEETMQKALRMVDESCDGFTSERYDLEFEANPFLGKAADDQQMLREELSQPSPLRVWAIAKALDLDYGVEELHQLTRIDRWFLSKLHNIHLMKRQLQGMDLNGLRQDPRLFLAAKQFGFSDKYMSRIIKEGIPACINPRYLRTPQQAYIDPAYLSPELGPKVAGSVATGGTDSSVESSSRQRVDEWHVRCVRKQLGILPVAKQIDTLAAEFPAQTNYLYMTYNGVEDDVSPASTEQPLGLQSGQVDPKRDIRGKAFVQGELSPMTKLELSQELPHSEAMKYMMLPPVRKGNAKKPAADQVVEVIATVCWCWAAVVIVLALASSSTGVLYPACEKCGRMGNVAIVVNCNPETVSTDYDESDRLYFEELSLERVLDVNDFENPEGVVISVGGQTPNNLATALTRNGASILGTSVESIDTAEDRSKFSMLCDSLGIDQPEWSAFATFEEARHFANRVKYPVLVRPSYVLSGAAMRCVYDDQELEKYAQMPQLLWPKTILWWCLKYIVNAKEVEMDAVGCAGEIVNYAISEHVQNAGVHSGDATILLPAQKLYVETHRRIKKVSQKLCKALNISGPFNIQFMCKENEVKVIECNLRASRTVPFISKTFNVNFIEIATKVMLRVPVRPWNIHPIDTEFVGCKAPVFSFQRLKNSDPRLGVEMQSTGEVACFGRTPYEAYLKAWLSAGYCLPTKTILVSIGPQQQKEEFLPWAKVLIRLGYHLFATRSTYQTIKDKLDPSQSSLTLVYKPYARREPNVKTLIQSGKIDMCIVIPSSADSCAITEGFEMRRLAVDTRTALINDIKEATFLVLSLQKKAERERDGKIFFGIETWQRYQELK